MINFAACVALLRNFVIKFFGMQHSYCCLYQKETDTVFAFNGILK